MVSNSMHRGSVLTSALIIFIALVAVLSIVALSLSHKAKPSANGNTNSRVALNTNFRACTDEAKICPDGTAVGRTGPNCEFAPCPTNTNAPRNANTNTKTANTNQPLNTNSSDTSRLCNLDSDCGPIMCGNVCYNKAYYNSHGPYPECPVLANATCVCLSHQCTGITPDELQ